MFAAVSLTEIRVVVCEEHQSMRIVTIAKDEMAEWNGQLWAKAI
jgi:hypothetical protein